MIKFRLLLRISNKLHCHLSRGFSLTTVCMDDTFKKLEKNPYYEKYASKISDLQKSSPEEFLSKLGKAEEKPSIKKEIHSALSEKGKPILQQETYSFSTQKKLDDVMKTKLLDKKSPEEIEHIWNLYFQQKDCISGVMPAHLFDRIMLYGAKYSVFLFPLPRDHGYEFMVAQFAGSEVHFTSLVNFQAYGENAPEQLLLVHYSELKDTKGIVLMHGSFDKNILNALDAQCLANQLQLFYGGADEKKLKLLEKFHNEPQFFKHMDLIKEIEQLDFFSRSTSKKPSQS